MKILTGIDIPFNPFGGSPIICNDWYSHLPDGYEALFLTMPSSQAKWWQIPNVRFLKTQKVKNPKKYLKYIESLSGELSVVIDQYQPDIIHIQHINYGLSRAFANLKINIPKIGICHGTDTQAARQNKFFMENLIEIANKADLLIFPAQHMADDFFSVYPNTKEYKVLEHGIPANTYADHQTHNFDGTLRLLYAGRLNWHKGVDIAVKALFNLKDLPVTLDIIGDEDQKKFKDELKQYVKTNRLEMIVSFHPMITRDQLWKKFEQYDCILIPSRELEVFSLTAIEAQARGLVVIYGNGGGITDTIKDSGMLIRDNDPSTLANILRNIYSKPRLLEKYRRLGYKNSLRFPIEKQINGMIKISEELVKQYE